MNMTIEIQWCGVVLGANLLGDVIIIMMSSAGLGG